MSSVKQVYSLPQNGTYKFSIDGRYDVYIKLYSRCMDAVIDTKTGEDITDTLEGAKLHLEAMRTIPERM